MVTDDEQWVMDRQRLLLPDLERIEAYGAGQPDSYVGIRYGGPRLVKLVALFTDPDGHREAVLGLVEHPEDVEVGRAPYTRVELARVHAEVVSVIDAHAGSWIGHGPGLTAVRVHLRDGFEQLGAELRERFGDRVEVKIGGQPPQRA